VKLLFLKVLILTGDLADSEATKGGRTALPLTFWVERFDLWSAEGNSYGRGCLGFVSNRL